MHYAFLNTATDLAWLRDVHLKDRTVPEHLSAVLEGNVDSPDEIHLYASREPDHDEQPVCSIYPNVDKSEELPGVTTADPEESFSGVSSRRTGLMGVFLACALALSGIAHATEPTTGQPKAPRAKPISTISVKVQPAAKMDGKLWRITTVDQDSCVAWVSTTAPNLEQAEMQAFRECRKAINAKVDEAAEKAGV